MTGPLEENLANESLGLEGERRRGWKNGGGTPLVVPSSVHVMVFSGIEVIGGRILRSIHQYTDSTARRQHPSN